MRSRNSSVTRTLNRSTTSLTRRPSTPSGIKKSRRSTSERSTRSSSRFNVRGVPSNTSRGRSLSQSRSVRNGSVAGYNDPCVCGPDFYANVLGPTADETILVGLQTFMKFCHECPPHDEVDEDTPVERRSVRITRRSVRDVGLGTSRESIRTWKDPSVGPSREDVRSGPSFTSFRRSSRDTRSRPSREPYTRNSTRRVSMGNGRKQSGVAGSPSGTRRIHLRSDPSVCPSSISPNDGIEGCNDEGIDDEDDDVDEIVEVEEIVEERGDGVDDDIDEDVMIEEEYWVSKSCQTPRKTNCSKVLETGVDTCNLTEESQTECQRNNFSSQTDYCLESDGCQTSLSSSSDARTQTARSCMSCMSNMRLPCHKSVKTVASNRCRKSQGTKSQCSQRDATRRSLGTGSSKLAISCTCCPCSDETSSTLPDCSCSSCKMKEQSSCITKISTRCTCKPEGSSSPSTCKKQVGVCCCDDSTSTTSTTGYDSSNSTEDDCKQALQCGDSDGGNIRYAITKITKFYSYSTFEVMKSTKRKPKTMPKTLEGVFVLKNVSN